MRCSVATHPQAVDPLAVPEECAFSFNKSIKADPTDSEVFQIALICPRDCVSFAALDPKCVLARRQRLELFHKGRVDQDRAMNLQESVGPQLLGDGRNRNATIG